MALGALLTAGATLLAAAVFALTAWVTRPAATRRRTGDICLFFLISTAFLFLSGLRQVAAYLATNDPAWTHVDRALFLALLVPAAAALVPLAHVTAQTVLGRRRAVLAATAFFAALVPAGLATAYIEGISGPQTSAWGSEWSLNGPLTFVFLALIVILPALLFSTLLLRASGHVGGLDGRRIRRVGAAVLVYYLVFTLDALALPGAFLVAERLATAAVAWWAYSAYARPV